MRPAQPDLFSYTPPPRVERALARATDPDTSRQAASSVTPILPELEAVVLKSLRAAGRNGMTLDELLAGIPWRVAFALQDDGWWLRRDIIWAKPAPMPESVRDRCTTAHEYIFMFAKNGRAPLLWVHRDRGMEQRVYEQPAPDFRWVHRHTREETAEPQTDKKNWRRINLWSGLDYYYDFEAIMEPSSQDSHARADRGRSDHHKWADGGPGNQTIAYAPVSAGRMIAVDSPSQGRVTRRSRKGAPNDGYTWATPTTPRAAAAREAHPERDGTTPRQAFMDVQLGDLVAMRNKRSVWTVSSEPFAEAHFATFPPGLIEPCILAGCPPGGVVLDPFFGAGTTGLVCDRLGRECIGIELSAKYAAMAERRIRADHGPLFAAAAPVAARDLFSEAAE